MSAKRSAMRCLGSEFGGMSGSTGWRVRFEWRDSDSRAAMQEVGKVDGV